MTVTQGGLWLGARCWLLSFVGIAHHYHHKNNSCCALEQTVKQQAAQELLTRKQSLFHANTLWFLHRTVKIWWDPPLGTIHLMLSNYSQCCFDLQIWVGKSFDKLFRNLPTRWYHFQLEKEAPLVLLLSDWLEQTKVLLIRNRKFTNNWFSETLQVIITTNASKRSTIFLYQRGRGFKCVHYIAFVGVKN